MNFANNAIEPLDKPTDTRPVLQLQAFAALMKGFVHNVVHHFFAKTEDNRLGCPTVSLKPTESREVRAVTIGIEDMANLTTELANIINDLALKFVEGRLVTHACLPTR